MLSEGRYRGMADSASQPIIESDRLPKEAAGPGLTSTLLPRNLEEGETQLEEAAKII